MKVSLNTILSWFKTGHKPTENQFMRTWNSFWHKDDKIPISQIENLEQLLSQKVENQSFIGHLQDENAHGLDVITEYIRNLTPSTVESMYGFLHPNSSDEALQFALDNEDKLVFYGMRPISIGDGDGDEESDADDDSESFEGIEVIDSGISIALPTARMVGDNNETLFYFDRTNELYFPLKDDLSGIENDIDTMEQQLAFHLNDANAHGINNKIKRVREELSYELFRFLALPSNNDLMNIDQLLNDLPAPQVSALILLPNGDIYFAHLRSEKLNLSNCNLKFIGGTVEVISNKITDISDFSTENYVLYNFKLRGINTNQFQNNRLYHFTFWRLKNDSTDIIREPVVIGQLDDFQDNVKTDIIKRTFITDAFLLNSDPRITHNLNLSQVTGFKFIVRGLVANMPPVFGAEDLRYREFVSYVQFTENEIIFQDWNDQGLSTREFLVTLEYVI